VTRMSEHENGAASLSTSELTQMLSLFNDAAAKLQTTHEQLRAEVARLQGELKAANDEIARSRRLAALGEMAAGIAHEVRNPLGSIRLHAKMMEEDLVDRPEQRTLASKILQAVRGLDAVVGDVLSFSREMRVRPYPNDSMELLQGAVGEAMESHAGRVKSGVCGSPPTRDHGTIEVVYQSIAGDAEHVWCDAGLVHRALVNVVQNAVQAMCPDEADLSGMDEKKRRGCALSRRSVLMVGASSRLVMTPDGGERPVVVLSVRDSGPGLPAEVMERMFNPFFTTRAAGTGLGLAIVHRIVDAHGGSVRVRNHEQGGAVVELLLPVGEERTGGQQGSVVVRQTGRAQVAAA
jgi:signal transduction histidine kinase